MVLENATTVIPSTVDINYLFGSLGTLIALSAVMTGVGFQTVIKWWDKWQDGQPIPFDKKFIGTAVTAFIGALMVAVPLLNAGIEELNKNIPQYGLVIAWVVTAGWAYALNNGVNGAISKVYDGAEARLLKSGRLDKIIDQKISQKLGNNNNTPTSTDINNTQQPKQ